MANVALPANDPATEVSSRTGQPRPKVETAEHDSLHAVVMRIDLNGSITEANTLALQVLGCSKEHIIGTYYGRFLILSHLNTEPALDVSIDDPIASCLVTGQAVVSAYGMLRRADRKSLQPIEVCIAPVYRQSVIAGAILIIEGEDLSPIGYSDVRH